MLQKQSADDVKWRTVSCEDEDDYLALRRHRMDESELLEGDEVLMLANDDVGFPPEHVDDEEPRWYARTGRVDRKLAADHGIHLRVYRDDVHGEMAPEAQYYLGNGDAHWTLRPRPTSTSSATHLLLLLCWVSMTRTLTATPSLGYRKVGCPLELFAWV